MAKGKMEIKRILCPTDFSEFSARALAHAIALAKWYGSSLTALHVYWVPSVPALPEYPAPLMPTPRTHEEMRAALQRFVEPARVAGLQVDFATVEGDPVRAILDYAGTPGSDLIVLGTHGRGGFERFVLGSVTEKIVRKATCPVLTVPRPPESMEVTGPAIAKRIVCPIDFSKASVRALEYALSLTQESGGRLTAVHVLEWLADEPALELTHFNVPEYQRHLKADAQERLHKLIPDEARTYAEINEVVTVGKPYHQILKIAREEHDSLIVMGCHGRNPIDIMLFGSTTQHVVRDAPCPVMTLRA